MFQRETEWNQTHLDKVKVSRNCKTVQKPTNGKICLEDLAPCNLYSLVYEC